MNQATLQPVLDGLLAEGLEQERLPGPGRAADDQVLPAVHPFQGAQRLLGRGRDRGQRRDPRRRRSCRWGTRPRPGGWPARSVPGRRPPRRAGPEDLDRFPALRLRGGDHLGGVPADVGQPQPPQQLPRPRPAAAARPAPRAGGAGASAWRSPADLSAARAGLLARGWCWPSRAQPVVPWARERVLAGDASVLPGAGWWRRVVVEDRGQVGLGEPAVHGGVPQRPVDLAGVEQLGQRRRASAILTRILRRPRGGGLAQPQPGARHRGRGTPPPRRCVARGIRSSAPAGAGGKCVVVDPAGCPGWPGGGGRPRPAPAGRGGR